MLVAVGYIVILVPVLGGYMLAGGHLRLLFQPIGLPTILGIGVGVFMVDNDRKATNATTKVLPGLLKDSKYIKALYMEAAALLYVVLSKIRHEGMMSIEADIKNPYENVLFANYPAVQADHHALDFICDYLRLTVGGNLDPLQIEALMGQEIDTRHREAEQPARIITKAGDAVPAFGIVAIVMGMMHTMGSVGLPPAELGKLIASALADTFLGVLLTYDFIGSLSSLLEQRAGELAKLSQHMRAVLLASMNGYVPAIAVEFGHRVLFSVERPSFAELEDHVHGVKIA